METPEEVEKQIRVIFSGLQKISVLLTIGEMAALREEEQPSKLLKPYWPDYFDAMQQFIPEMSEALQDVEYFLDKGLTRRALSEK